MSKGKNVDGIEVLIIVDDEGVLNTLGDFLNSYQCKAVVARLPDIGIQWIALKRFSAIVVDVNMKGVEGIQLAGYIRASHHNSNVPLFVFSEQLTVGVQAKLTKIGTSGVFNRREVKLGEVIAQIYNALVAQREKPLAYNPQLVQFVQENAEKILGIHFNNALEAKPLALRHKHSNELVVCSQIVLFGENIFGGLMIHFDQVALDLLVQNSFPHLEMKTEGVSGFCDAASTVANEMAGRLRSKLTTFSTGLTLGLPHSFHGEQAVPRLVSNPSFCLPYVVLGKGNVIVEIRLGNVLEIGTHIRYSGIQPFVYNKDVIHDDNLLLSSKK